MSIKISWCGDVAAWFGIDSTQPDLAQPKMTQLKMTLSLLSSHKHKFFNSGLYRLENLTGRLNALVDTDIGSVQLF